MHALRILLAEDDRSHQRLLLSALAAAEAPVDVTITSCHDQLLAAARTDHYDCIVLDFDLPPYTAPELVNKLAPLQPDAPCIVVSSSDEQRVVIESIRHGVADFVHKDDAILGTSLWRRIEKVVREARARRVEQRKMNRRLQTLELQAKTDPLTGLMNRRAIEAALDARVHRSDRRRQTAMIMFDLDHFKKINDLYGHEAGDQILCAAADVIRQAADDADLVVRWGGEEFLVLRQSDSLAEAWIWADDVRRRIMDEVKLPDDRPQTASVGVDVIPNDQLQTDSIMRVDHALYLAKDAGRNRVCTWAMVEVMNIAEELQLERMMTPRARLMTLVSRVRESLGDTQRDHVGPHGQLVKRLATLIAGDFLEDDATVADLELAAEFHDVGKIGIPESLLALPRSLRDGEGRFLREHARFGADILRACGAPDAAIAAVAHHHDRFDSAEPASDGSIMASILSACDAVIAMTSNRPYAPALTPVQALAELQAYRGSQFHPQVVDSLSRMDTTSSMAA